MDNFELSVVINGKPTTFVSKEAIELAERNTESMEAALNQAENTISQWRQVFRNIASLLGRDLPSDGAIQLLPTYVAEEMKKQPNVPGSCLTNLVEELAAVEHEQWSIWAGRILEEEKLLTDQRRNRWTRSLVPYSNLSEAVKEQDRRWARKVLPIVAKHLSALITSSLHVTEKTA